VDCVHATIKNTSAKKVAGRVTWNPHRPSAMRATNRNASARKESIFFSEEKKQKTFVPRSFNSR
jgi:hypothetical protein